MNLIEALITPKIKKKTKFRKVDDRCRVLKQKKIALNVVIQ